MCGILGIINTKGESASSALLRSMCNAIRHRGPDDEGIIVDRMVGLGHRRLSILDLTSLGKQPMISYDGRYTIVFNGEIYNFPQLRARLQSLGIAFSSQTDTEVILYGYAIWGIDVVKELNGMFAFAIWDAKDQKLILARDRFGIKPLYITKVEDQILFSSEIKAFKCHPKFNAKVDPQGVIEYFTFQNFLSQKTLFSGVEIIPAGHIYTWSPGDSSFSNHKYWDFSFEEPQNPKNEEEYIHEFQFLFRQAVNRQLISDVEIGAYLSGGIDSGSIASVAASQLQHLKTFTCGFDLHSASGLEMNFDERQLSEYLSFILKSEHYEIVLKAGDMERILPRLTYHLEEPRVGQSYANMYIAGLASKFVKVVLSGAGGDEIFGGYPWRYYKAANNIDFNDYVNKYFDFWQRLVPDNLSEEFFKPILSNYKSYPQRELFHSIFPSEFNTPKTSEDYVNLSLYFESKTFLHGLLVVEDKLSMSYGLEARLPFLDNDLVDFGMKLPINMKLSNLKSVSRVDENDTGASGKRNIERTADGKKIIRKAMGAFVPQKILEGQKQGFSAPDASWFRGESIDFVRKKLLIGDSPIYEYLDKKTAHLLINEHLEGKQNRRLLVWSLLNFDEWCKQNIIN